MAVLGNIGRALALRNARIFFAGSLVAWTGLWMQRIAVAWLAWELTGSAFWVGMVAFCDLAPAVVVSPLAGAVADRMDRLRLATLSQLAIALQALLVAGLTAAGAMGIGLLLLLETCGGIAAAFAQPARQTLMPGIVPRQDLAAAVAMNSLVFNIARFVGPALAGPIIALWGVVPAIGANAAGYALAAGSMALLRVAATERQGHKPGASLWGEVVQGMAYARRHAGLGPLLLYAALSGVLLRGMQEILPPYVERLFGRGAESLALLTACFGIGALCAGLWVANRGRLEGATRLAVWSGLGQAAGLALFVAGGVFPLGLLAAALVGGFASVHGICVQTLLQHATAAAFRGRMLSLWGMITRACPAIGALALGAAGEVFGLRLPTLAAVLIFLLVFAWGLARLGRMRRVLEGAPADGGAR